MNRIAAGLLALGMSLPMADALAQTPGKPIRVIVPWPAGGTVDGVARVIGPSFSSGLGRTLIVENKAGAGGSIGQAEAAKAPADGNTVLLVFDTHAVNHLLYKNLGYDPFKSFEHVSLLVTSPQVLAGATNFAPSTVAELVAHAKSNPGKVTYATVGAGSSNHLNALLLANRTGIEMTHVPYKGGAPMMIDLVGGQVNVMFVSAPQAIPQAKAGRIKALAIGAAHRIPSFRVRRPSPRRSPGSPRSPGWGCSCRRGRRRKSSGGCTRRRRRRLPVPKCAANSQARDSRSSGARPRSSSPLPAPSRRSGRR